MAGFYEILQVSVEASPDQLRAAWQEQVAATVRKMRSAEAKRQDPAPIEARRIAINEAWAVLSDPVRRRRYDRFREVSKAGIPADADALWKTAAPSMIDPGAALAVDVLRLLTDLKVGTPLSTEAAPPRPAVAVVIEESPSSVSAVSGVSVVSKAVGHAVGHAVVGHVPALPAAPAFPAMPPPSLTPGGSSAIAPPRPRPNLDRTVPTESLARLFDQYGPTGAFLASARELRKVSLNDVATLTRISQRFLDAMERDAYTELPSGTFVRGYLKMVVKGIEALEGREVDEFVDGYMSRFHRVRG